MNVMGYSRRAEIRQLLYFWVLFRLVKTFAAGRENTVQFFDHRQKILIVLLDRNSRTKLADSVAFRLVHTKAEVLQHLKVGVCSLSNATWNPDGDPMEPGVRQAHAACGERGRAERL
jgi:hypothetical protein